MVVQCKYIEDFRDNVAYWNGNTCRTCSRSCMNNEVDRLSICRDRMLERYKGVADKDDNAISYCRLLVYKHIATSCEYLVGNLGKGSS